MNLNRKKITGLVWMGQMAAWAGFGLTAAHADILPAPGAVVDEPQNPRASLGLTLRDLGHHAEDISQFQRFVQGQNLAPEKLLTPAELTPPANARRILLDPELLSPQQLAYDERINRNLGSWHAKGDYLASTAQDVGPVTLIPLHVERSGLYRMWVRYYAWPTGIAPSRLKIYRAGQIAQGPVFNDEFYDTAPATEGNTWKDYLVDLPAGDYSIQLAHVKAIWQYQNQPHRLVERLLDCLYFTDELWAAPPTDAALADLRATPLSGIQRTAQPALSPAAQSQWRQWQVRPISWEKAATHPALFDLSRRFWRDRVDALATQNTDGPLADYRSPQRQVVFDDRWNIVANPIDARRYVDGLQSDLNAVSSGNQYLWLTSQDFTRLNNWARTGTTLIGGSSNKAGSAEADIPIRTAGRYAVWVRAKNLPRYYAAWHLDASAAGGPALSYDYNETNYPSDWVKAGDLDVRAPGTARLQISTLPSPAPAAPRIIRGFLLTTDQQFQPAGDQKNPLPRADYLAQTRALGATPQNPLLLWATTRPYLTPLSLEPSDTNSWPRLAQLNTPPETLSIPAGGQRSFQIGMRSAVTTPLELRVVSDGLHGANGVIQNKVVWRVVAFGPYGPSRSQWTPFALLRRPWVTVPPLSLASVWVTIDARDVPAGDYTAPIRISGNGTPERIVNLRVHVSAVPAAPQRRFLFGGYTNPPEGPAYENDYTRHGLNTWYTEISKAEMLRRHIRLLMLVESKFTPDYDAYIRARIARLRGMGLDYSDWVFVVRDEPVGTTPEALAPFLQIAQAIKHADPRVQVSFNPADRATLATFNILDPLCDLWIPYTLHRVAPAREVAAKRAIFTAKPWMWYTIPAYTDKVPGTPILLFDQLRSVPAEADNPAGTVFFALYYPFIDAWDSGHEWVRDVSVFVLPSYYGPVATPGWEAIGEAAQDAGLAQMVKERSNGSPQTSALVARGTTEQLLAWLERNGGAGDATPDTPIDENPVMDAPATDAPPTDVPPPGPEIYPPATQDVPGTQDPEIYPPAMPDNDTANDSAVDGAPDTKPPTIILG